jgi:signal peptidase I, bacterial type
MKSWIKEVLPYIIIIIVVVLIKAFIVTPVLVDGKSMHPKLHNNDLMLLNKTAYKFGTIKRFDIVVVEINNKKLIKRVIGLPGETIEFKDNKLYINGEEIKQDFLEKDIVTKDFNIEDIYGVKKIPDSKYFVMGDNRTDSLDSRSIVVGMIHKKQILGKSTFTLFPFSRFGTKK